MSLCSQVLSCYRRIMRISRKWEAREASDTLKEKLYIQDEARSLFKQNKHLTSEDEIAKHLVEADARIVIGEHYRIPYPRHVNIPQNLLPPGKKKTRTREEIMRLSKPIYLKSYNDDIK